jgi:hypothetical protein
MSTIITANQIKGRATGALFFSGFGALWLILGLYVRESLSVSLSLAIGATFIALATTAFWLMRQAERFPKLPEDRAMNRQFHRINLAQWIAIGITGFTFARLHIDVYAVSAMTAIVGIHLFPLAKLFRYPQHNLTGAALVLWASVTVLIVPKDNLQSTTAIGTGLILWLSAALTLALATRLTRNTTHSRYGAYVL